VEVELRKNEARYRSLVVASAQIVWSTNAAGEVTDDLPFWRAYTGQSREDIMGWGWSNAIHGEDRRRATEAWAHAVATRSLYDTEIRIRGADGEHRDFAVRGVPVIDPDGTLREWVGTCTDITQRKGMEAEASRYREQLRALAKELVASDEQERWQISRYIHDTIIQNLSLSSMRLGAFQKKLAATPGDTEGLQIATTRKLVDDAIAECRTVMSELTPPLLNELGLVPALEELVESLHQRHGISIEMENEGLSKPMDNALRGLLFQSVRELVINALKHAGPCSIRVVVADSVDGVLIRVQDNGRGFDPVRKKSHDMKEGGFGLFSVRERVEGMGGQLAIESAPGQGVTATIALPIPESG
jgi:PAS domain S-box-containing protein